jgi:hypothetical protein
MVNWGAQILAEFSAPTSDNLSCCCVAPTGSGCDPGDMSSAGPDHKTLFLRNYELYEAAKERGESKEIQRLALLAVSGNVQSLRYVPSGLCPFLLQSVPGPVRRKPC